MRALAVFLVLVVPACSPATIRSIWELRMPLPASLKGEDIEFLEIGGGRMAPRRQLNIGAARVTGFARNGWEVSRAEDIVHSETEYSFRTEEGAERWRCACSVVREHNYFDAEPSSGARLDEWVECGCANEPETEAWKLTLVTTMRARMRGADIVSEGELTDGERLIDVTSRYDIEGVRLRPLVPTGFLFADGNEWIAAAETSFAGGFHIRSDVAERERRAIIVASAALLLRQSVGTPDEE